MAVDSGGRAVSCPSGVRNTGVRVEDLGHVWLLLLDELLQLDDLSNLLESKDLILLVSIYSQTGTVITSVLQLSDLLVFIRSGSSGLDIRKSKLGGFGGHTLESPFTRVSMIVFLSFSTR
jgi:hypothetical protein